jgi:hypothetical protein
VPPGRQRSQPERREIVELLETGFACGSNPRGWCQRSALRRGRGARVGRQGFDSSGTSQQIIRLTSRTSLDLTDADHRCFGGSWFRHQRHGGSFGFTGCCCRGNRDPRCDSALGLRRRGPRSTPTRDAMVKHVTPEARPAPTDRGRSPLAVSSVLVDRAGVPSH